MPELNAPLLTFIEVAKRGSFRRAADAQHLTQAAITTRIKTLERSLGFPLFIRSQHGISLSEQGSRFLTYAQTAVTAIAQGRDAARRAPIFRGHLRFMSQYLLLEQFALDWVSWMRAHAPQISLSIDSGYSEHASGYIASGVLDMAIGYQERRTPGIVFEQLFKERLVLVTSFARTSQWKSHYIEIEWDEAFAEVQRNNLGDLVDSAAIRAPFAEAARLMLLRTPGSAYVLERVARQHIEAGVFKRVPGARTFSRPAFAVYPQKSPNSTLIEVALTGLRELGRRSR